MSSLTYTAALLLCAGALGAGAILGWAFFQLRAGARYVTAARHGEELLAMRRRYRRRLRALRDAMLRHRLAEENLREKLQDAATRQADEARHVAAVLAEARNLRVRLDDAECVLGEARAALAEGRLREEALGAQLAAALDKIAAFEREHGLLRIEREELVARTQRLRALPALVDPATASIEVENAPGSGARAEIADRDARIHELECQLRESAARVSELESNLQVWKYRIAPLALHLEIKRERARKAADGAPDPGYDDLKRIRSIGRGLEKKLRAEGVMRIAQIAAMSPAELANLAVRVGLAASRPARDAWAEQARDLCNPEVARPRAEAG